MKTTDMSITTASTSNNEALASIDTASLEDVTGGCAACGSDCAAGPAPTAQASAPRANVFGAFARR